MERGDYSGAVRRITTAIEVAVEAVVKREINAVAATEAAEAADDFIKKTRNNFVLRLAKYEELSGRKLSQVLHDELRETRRLRHRIVNEAYRISAGERGRAQPSVDTGTMDFQLAR